MQVSKELRAVTPSQCRAELINGLKHDRHHNVIWSRDDKSYHVNVDGVARRVPGVHSLIKVFCVPPDYNKLAKFVARSGSKAPSDWDDFVQYANKVDEKGKEGGTLVHAQIEAYAKGGRAMLLQQHPRPHGYTMKLIEWMEKHGLIPLLSEWPIYDELHLGFATSVDMVVWNTKDKMYEIWELKTGYHQVFTLGDDRCKGPLRPYFDNSNLSLAMIQAMFAKMALKYRYDLHVAARVILVNNDGVRSKVLPQNVLKNLYTIYTRCGQHLKMTRKRERLWKEKTLTGRALVRYEMQKKDARRPLHERPITRSERVARGPKRVIRKKSKNFH